MSGAAQPLPKSILILHSFGQNAAPFNAVAAAFQTAVFRSLGERVDFYQAALELDRFADATLQRAQADFLQKRFAGRHLDLIVPIGSLAAQFVVQYRELAFSETPVVFVATDPRLLSPELLRKNATAVSQDIRIVNIVEDILQMAPDTTNIVVVLGASPVERFWADEIRHETGIFNGRVNFT
jgi:hypothetical protein